MRSSLKKYDLSRRSAKYASESLPCRSTSRRASRRSAACWLTAQSRGRSASQTTYVAQMIAALARLMVSPCSKRPGWLLGSMPTNPIVDVHDRVAEDERRAVAQLRMDVRRRDPYA